MFYNFNINTFKFINEVGGKTIISKSETLRIMVDFFQNRHLRPLELVFGPFIQRTYRSLKILSLKYAKVKICTQT
jgi:hypothetical protein